MSSSQKTSSRSNAKSFKGHTRKNGGGTFKFIETGIPGLQEAYVRYQTGKGDGLEEYVKYFYKKRSLMGLPKKCLGMSFEEMANETIRDYLEKGKNLKEIIGIFKANLENKLNIIIKLEFFAVVGCPQTIKEYVGVDERIFLVDWNNSVAVLTKLKALKNDDENGKLTYRSKQSIEDKTERF